MRNDAYEDIPPTLRDKDVPDFKDDDKFEAAFDHLLRHLEDEIAPLGDIHGSRPALPAWYIERDNIMDELENRVLIDSKQPVVVTSKQQVSALHGMGGIGKTTVASAFCMRCDVRRYFTDGIFWVSLGKNPEITQRQADIGMIFGDERKEYLSPEIGFNRLQNLLADKKVLLVLDDVWEKEHAAAFRMTGNLNRVLMTSRSRRLVTQLGAVATKLDTLSIDEGIRLFDERLNRAADAERPHDAIERQIIELLDGYTLAVALASAKLLENGADYAPRLLERLQKRQESDNPSRSLVLAEDDKQENVEVSLSLSYEDLTADEQRRFRILGVLAPNEPFPLSLAHALWRDDDDEDTEDALEKLQSMALISRDDSRLYEQHAVLRAYAIALLKRESEYETHYHAYLQHITEITEKFDELPPEDWRTLDNVIPHILYVGDTLAESYQSDENLGDIAFDFAINTKNYVFRRPEIHRHIWLEMGLALAQSQGNVKREAIFLNNMGLICSDLGDKQQALNYLSQALPIRRQVGDKSGEATTLMNIGTVYQSLAQTEQALDYYHQALPILREVGNKGMEAITLNNIGTIYNSSGKKVQALKYYNQVLYIVQKIGDKFTEFIVLANIAVLYSEDGKLSEAIKYLSQCVTLGDNIGHPDTEMYRSHLIKWQNKKKPFWQRLFGG